MARTSRWPAALLIGLFAAILAAPATAARFPYESGETVTLNGIVTDAAGAPLPDLEVVLEVSKMGFSVHPWGNSKKEIVRGSTETNENGEFGLEWDWAKGYNHFELHVVVPATAADESAHVLERIDISKRVAQGSPISAPVVIEDTTYLDFLATLESDDQRKVFRQMGQPERVDLVAYEARKEVSWWYFEAGKVYLFVDGRLAKVDEFDPVRPL